MIYDLPGCHWKFQCHGMHVQTSSTIKFSLTTFPDKKTQLNMRKISNVSWTWYIYLFRVHHCKQDLLYSTTANKCARKFFCHVTTNISCSLLEPTIPFIVHLAQVPVWPSHHRDNADDIKEQQEQQISAEEISSFLIKSPENGHIPYSII